MRGRDKLMSDEAHTPIGTTNNNPRIGQSSGVRGMKWPAARRRRMKSSTIASAASPVHNGANVGNSSGGAMNGYSHSARSTSRSVAEAGRTVPCVARSDRMAETFCIAWGFDVRSLSFGAWRVASSSCDVTSTSKKVLAYPPVSSWSATSRSHFTKSLT